VLHDLGPKLQAAAEQQGLSEEQLLALMEEERIEESRAPVHRRPRR
jgi:hypothetical protein